MFIDEIWDVVTEDHHERKHYEPNLQTTAWFTVTDDSRVVALLALDVINSVTLRIHPMVIPTERVRSVEICKTLIDWWLALDDEHTKLIAEIPECYKHVKRFAVRMGLKPEDVCMLDDRPENIQGALDADLQAYHFQKIAPFLEWFKSETGISIPLDIQDQAHG